MLTRRGFVGCALCAVAGFSAAAAEAQSTPAPGLKRTLLSRVDGPVAGYETIETRTEIPAGFVVPRHTHFGIETAYVLDGSIELDIEGMAAKTYSPGEGFQVPTGAPHGGKVGDKAAVLASVYVVEKGKPLVTPV